MAASSLQNNKRHKVSDEAEAEAEEEALLPGLPDHLAQLCLGQLQHQIPAPLLFSVCRPWRRLLYSPSFPAPFLSLYALLSTTTTVRLACFDPISSAWAPLPPPPHHHRLLLRHPSFISRQLPVQTVSAAGKLVLLAATDRDLLPALPAPSVFDPATARWLPGPPLPSGPRRWCAAGSAGGALYVASGVGSEYSSETARSAERWDMTTRSSGGGWEAVRPLKDSRFSREAVGMAWSRRNNKLCVADRDAKEGAVYDVETDRWEEMPPGMVAGWTGPAAAEGDSVCVVEESSGALRSYDWGGDTWTEVVRLEGLQGACAVAAGGGKVVAASGGGRRVTVVDVGGGGRRRWWEVAVPEGTRVMALHVLPRMCCPTS